MKIKVTDEPDKPKRILIFAIAYLPYQGGAEVAVREITDRLPGFEFDLVTGRYDKNLPAEERIGNVNVYRVGRNLNIDSIIDKIFCTLKILKSGLKLHNQKNYDIVWSVMAAWAGIASLFFKVLHPAVKYFLNEQSGDSDWFIGIRTKWWNFIYKYVYLKADYIQVLSEWLKQRVLKYGYKGEIAVIPNGVDRNKFRFEDPRFSQADLDSLRQKLEIPQDNQIIFSISRLMKKNGVDDLIKAFKILVDNYKIKASLILIGWGRLEMKLKDLAYDLGVYDDVKFLGNVPNEEAPAYCKLADVFVRPSLSEGQGIAFMEAMATGLPIIATPVGGIPDFLKDGEMGLFCKVRDPQDLAQKIKVLLEDDVLREKIIKNSLKLVEDKYDWDKIVVQMREIFYKI